jgi:hypothetical protein
VKENKKIKGRHEIVTVPGKYVLEVYKNEYDNVMKEIELVSGMNTVNVELNHAKKFKINISIYNYETKTPIENANLKISYSKNDIVEEGLTDATGNFVLETVKNDDFITVFALKDGFFPCQRTFIKDLPESKVSLNKPLEEKEKDTIVEKVWKIGGSENIERDIYIFLVKESFIIEQKAFLLIMYSNYFEENFETCFLMTERISSAIEIKTEDNQASKGIISLLINKKGIKLYKYFYLDEFYNINFDEEREAEDNFDEIIRLVFQIKNPNLLKSHDVNYRSVINGLQKFSCEACLFCPNGNIFFIPPPQFSREREYFLWDMGFLDIRSDLFYEMGLLLKKRLEKDLFFNDWLLFLQLIIDHKIFSNLFETFHFNKGILSQSDRLLYEPAFIRAVKTIPMVTMLTPKEEQVELFSVDFLIYLCDLMKDNHNMVSFSIFKKKLASNLKNFKYQI